MATCLCIVCVSSSFSCTRCCPNHTHTFHPTPSSRGVEHGPGRHWRPHNPTPPATHHHQGGHIRPSLPTIPSRLLCWTRTPSARVPMHSTIHLRVDPRSQTRLPPRTSTPASCTRRSRSRSAPTRTTRPRTPTPGSAGIGRSGGTHTAPVAV